MSTLIGKKTEFNDLDYQVIANIKTLGLDMINAASSGHPGIVLGAAPIIYTLYAKHMVINNKNPYWINRDRFVMSGGHGSALLYATLFMSGFEITLDDLKSFRQFDSITPGHPEFLKTPGVDASTGPLGQGFANAVGMAIAEKFLNNRYLYDKENSFISHYTYCLCGDGDLMEGISYEAAAIAGNLGLGKLIVLYDSNNISLDRDTKETFKENIIDRFKASGWDTYKVENGDDLDDINEAITKAKEVLDKPSLIEIKTIIGKSSILENTSAVHGKPLTEDDLLSIKKTLGIRDIPFTVLQDAYNHMIEQISNRNNPIIENYEKIIEKIYPKIKDSYKNELKKFADFDLGLDLEDLGLSQELLNKSGRDISHEILNKIVLDDILMLGGAADVASSTKAYLDNMKDFTNLNPIGRNILFGVRELAVGAILNGITLSGIRSFGSTFLAFSDYLKPAIRMAALMKLPVFYIFTHDSIEVGEDGPTHQPIEQLIGLRSIPNTIVYRPYDANEIMGAYKNILNYTDGPSILVLSKDEIITLEETRVNDVAKGAYIIRDFPDYSGIIIATGKELYLAYEVSKKLESKGIRTRVVSMPSIELFEKQEKEYQKSILPTDKKTIVIEWGSSYSWYKYVKDDNFLFNVNDFGKSSKKADLIESLELDIETIAKKIENLLR